MKEVSNSARGGGKIYRELSPETRAAIRRDNDTSAARGRRRAYLACVIGVLGGLLLVTLWILYS